MRILPTDGGKAGRFVDGFAAVITGAGRGIGESVATRFAAAGISVVCVARGSDEVGAVVEGIRASGGQARALVADISRPDDVARVFEVALETFGRVDALVNCAGIVGRIAELADLSLDEWNEVIAVNLTGVFLCCRAAVPIMRAQGGGSIVTIGSATGKRALPSRSAYAASKLALVGLTRTLAHEVGRDGTTVNVISPYFVEGARLERVFTAMAEESGVGVADIRQERVNETALGRLVRPEDVADVALFLCSPPGAAITGQDINVSAGAVMY
jgi:NAD(P)-dependent dehydrogenase (short-subunit alcohol dehydrogenase family)